jgi:hypothetical protein
VLVATLLSGCAGGEAPTLSLPSLPSVGAISQPTAQPPASPGTQQPAAIVIDQTGRAGGSATDLYSRIASGAMKCWFTVGGPLKKDYVYHATADPASRGGKAQIVIHQRDTAHSNPRGLKSYLVDIEPTGELSATVKTENLKMPDNFAAAMTNDVARWTRGEDGCGKASAVADWIPSPPTNISEDTKTKAKKAKTKRKTKIKSAQAKASALSPSKAPAKD